MIYSYEVSVQLTSKTAKGQVFFRRLLKRQNSLLKGFVVTRKFPRVL